MIELLSRILIKNRDDTSNPAVRTAYGQLCGVVGIVLNLLLFGLKLRKKQAEEAAANADPEIDALVAARTAAKKSKNFAEADRIRDELKAMGVEIIDTPQGTKWRKV